MGLEFGMKLDFAPWNEMDKKGVKTVRRPTTAPSGREGDRLCVTGVWQETGKVEQPPSNMLRNMVTS